MSLLSKPALMQRYRRSAANITVQKLQYLTAAIGSVPHRYPLDPIEAKFVDDVADQAQQFLGAYEKMKGRCK